jgi:hypothetical protein
MQALYPQYAGIVKDFGILFDRRYSGRLQNTQESGKIQSFSWDLARNLRDTGHAPLF